MPPFTKDNAREMSARGVAARRRRREAELPAVVVVVDRSTLRQMVDVLRLAAEDPTEETL